jgi:hypothetical protein
LGFWRKTIIIAAHFALFAEFTPGLGLKAAPNGAPCELKKKLTLARGAAKRGVPGLILLKFCSQCGGRTKAGSPRLGRDRPDVELTKPRPRETAGEFLNPKGFY